MSDSGRSGSGQGRSSRGGQRGSGGGSGTGGSGAGGSDQRRGGGESSRRNAQGRERNRGPQRSFTESAPSQRTRRADPARLVAFEVLRAVAAEDAYANLVLPARIRQHGLDRRDAGFATELSYGALRNQGTYDAILARCVDRALDKLDPAVLDALRIGVHQLVAMRVPAHAALDQTVGLARAVIGAGPSID
jgi:16S rRNA (cytosine967-C5)-methyltransferase